MNKETHYFVRTPKYRLGPFWVEDEKTGYFSTIEDSKRFIKRQITYVKKSDKCIFTVHDRTNPEVINRQESLKNDAIRKLSLVEPIPFEIEVPEYI